ncbi:MAG: class IV adenylate cyclase [Candidatus Acidiferrales bacterium]
MPPPSRYTFSVLPRRETEIKLAIYDLAAILDKIRTLRPRPLGRVFEQNTLYDTPSADLRRRGCLLRLRIETPAPSFSVLAGKRAAIITAKMPAPASARSPYKQNLETEMPLKKVSDWRSALAKLGFRPAFRYEKYRSTFLLRGLHLDLDETPAGIFLELEGAPRAIDRAARALGFRRRDYLRLTYWDLYAAECRRRGQHPRNMLFGS